MGISTSESETHSLELCLVPGLFFFLATIFWTLAPSITLNDGVEYTISVHQLGIPHPSSYPIFVLLGRFFGYLPFGNLGMRLSIMSAFFGAGTLVGLAWIFHRIFRARKSLVLILPLALGFSGTFRARSSITEVYTLNAFMTVVVIGLLLGLFKGVLDRRFHFLFPFVIALALTNHHIFIISLPIFMIFWILVLFKQGELRILKAFVPIFILGFSVYLYLPIRSSGDPAIDRGDPETITQFKNVVFKRAATSSDDLAKNDPLVIRNQLKRFNHLLNRNFHWGFLFLGVFGLLLFSFKRDYISGVFLLVIGLMNTMVVATAFYSRTESILYMIDAFFIPGMVILAMGWACFWIFLDNLYSAKTPILKYAFPAVAVVFISYIAAGTHAQSDYRNRDVARRWAFSALNQLPRDAYVLCAVDEYFPLLYQQIVGRVRPDVKAAHTATLIRYPKTWHLKYDDGSPKVIYPVAGSAPHSEDEVAQAVKRALAFGLADRGGTTQFCLCHFTRAIIPDNWRPDLEGLVYRLVPERTGAFSDPRAALRSLTDGVLPKMADVPVDGYEKELLRNYSVALNNLGGLFLSRGRLNEAIRCWRLSEETDGNPLAGRLIQKYAPKTQIRNARID